MFVFQIPLQQPVKSNWPHPLPLSEWGLVFQLGLTSSEMPVSLKCLSSAIDPLQMDACACECAENAQAQCVHFIRRLSGCTTSVRTESTMWLCHAVSLGIIMYILLVVLLTWCVVVPSFFHYLYTVFALNLRAMTDITCTQKCIYMYMYMYIPSLEWGSGSRD